MKHSRRAPLAFPAVAAVVLTCAVAGLTLAARSEHASAVATTSKPTMLLDLRKRVRYVFVIYQENHSFDNYFGTYPGAENLSTALAKAHGRRQYDPIGKRWIAPFRIADPDIAGPSQARAVVYRKFDHGKMDDFVAEQERVSLAKGYDAADAQRIGELTMAHYDCDTIPYLWKYAHAFALFDHIFQGMTGPSTPGNIEAIAGQAGQTQWARNPGQAAAANDKGRGVPIVNDLNPAYPPYAADDRDAVNQIPQRYATIMLDLGGSADRLARSDTDGVRRDLQAVAASGRKAIPWGWYQEGYVSPTSAREGFEAHHDAPQYFAYLRNNPVFWKNVHPVQAMLGALAKGRLPDRGVFYIKGGSRNEFGWKPANRNPKVQAAYRGDDDHPGAGDSDHQVGEAFVATFVNAIAHSRYWKDSAIVITWDDAGGFYDHVPPPHFERCADGKPCGDGQRLPFILISPYARSGAVVHDRGDTASIVKFVETVFHLPAMAELPDERGSMPEGPRDANPAITNLLGAFDPQRLSGALAPIPAIAAEIPGAVVNAFPPKMSCASLGIVPVTLAHDRSPSGFAPRPLDPRRTIH
ncbi:MAG TPA: alkaline phosphatase family protein [Candidatus Dormibacteraeota bacterium]|nr:alkaline phosphatase family protein [Candidatus Dormibacteraeota bacterium]